MKRTFRVGVAFSRESVRTLVIVAENAMDAVITGLCEMGIVSLSLVTGITICEL